MWLFELRYSISDKYCSCETADLNGKIWFCHQLALKINIRSLWQVELCVQIHNISFVVYGKKLDHIRFKYQQHHSCLIAVLQVFVGFHGKNAYQYYQDCFIRYLSFESFSKGTSINHFSYISKHEFHQFLWIFTKKISLDDFSELTFRYSSSMDLILSDIIDLSTEIMWCWDLLQIIVEMSRDFSAVVILLFGEFNLICFSLLFKTFLSFILAKYLTCPSELIITSICFALPILSYLLIYMFAMPNV